MDLINQFIDNYKKKFNYYESVGRLAAGQLEAVLRSSGIRPWLPTGPKIRDA